MASDPLGLSSNPLFKIIGKIANPETYRPLAGKKTSSIAGSREPMPDYAGMNARQQAGPAKKSNVKPAAKGATPVKKVVKKSKKAKDSSPFGSVKAKGSVGKAAAKGGKPNSFGKPEVKGSKAKGKAADKMVSLKKVLNKKQKP